MIEMNYGQEFFLKCSFSFDELKLLGFNCIETVYYILYAMIEMNYGQEPTLECSFSFNELKLLIDWSLLGFNRIEKMSFWLNEECQLYHKTMYLTCVGSWPFLQSLDKAGKAYQVQTSSSSKKL